jgi:hypothetical protein
LHQDLDVGHVIFAIAIGIIAVRVNGFEFGSSVELLYQTI